MSANSEHDHIIYLCIAYKSKETKTNFDIIVLLLLFSNQVSHNIINYVINQMEKMSGSSEYDYINLHGSLLSPWKTRRVLLVRHYSSEIPDFAF